MWLDDTDTTTTTTDTTDTTDSTDSTTTDTQPLVFLSVNDFLQLRPAMSTFDDNEIQECINTSTELLNALCNGLVEQVINYNLVADRTTLDTANELYRTDFEFKQLKLAIVLQTQYTLNLGNDFSQGSQSMSTGGLNASFQRPENRDVYAPGVKELLRIARVYVFQEWGLKFQNSLMGGEDIDLSNYYNKDDSNTRFVAYYQPNSPVNSIAVINANNMVSFTDPTTINFANYQAQQVLDPTDNQYKSVGDIINSAWIGGYNKNVYTIPETTTAIQTALKALPELTYISVYAGEILVFPTDNDYQQFKNVTNTTDNDFKTFYGANPDWSYKQVTKNIESTAIYQLDLEQYPEFVDLQNQVNTNTTNIATNTANIATNTTNITNNTNAITAIQNDYVTTDTAQLITATKTLNNGFQLQHTKNWAPIIKFLETDNSVVAMLGYTTFSDMTASNNKFTLQGPALFEMVNADIDGTGFTDNCLVPKKYVDNQIATIPTIDWSNIQASSVNFPNATNINVANGYTPINDNSLATKSYVDSKVDLKFFQTTIATSSPYITAPAPAGGGTTTIATVITLTDSTYTDRDIAFIEDTLASEAKPRRHSALLIGTDNSICYIGAPPPDGSLDVGAIINVYYYN